MKNLLTTFILVFAIITTSFAQDDKSQKKAEEYFNKAMEKASSGKLEESLPLFDKSIELMPENGMLWYNRGIAKAMLGNYDEAFIDFDRTVDLMPDYKKAYLNRGTSKKKLTDYAGAISDYNNAIKLDENYGDAYYNRGLVYEMLSKKDSACIDFKKAKELGSKQAKDKVDRCNDTTKTTTPINFILSLTKKASSDSYGFTEANPVKVGSGSIYSGPTNQRDYLDLLRDAQGKPLKYTRLGSCCAYKSPGSFMGTGLLDKYEITYKNEKAEVKKAVVYITFYDYEEPQILVGFKTIGQK